jgi:hypothetical protein
VSHITAFVEWKSGKIVEMLQKGEKRVKVVKAGESLVKPFTTT